MRKGFLAAVAGLFAGAGLALAQAPSAPRSPYNPIESSAGAGLALAPAPIVSSYRHFLPGQSRRVEGSTRQWPA
jgi:hypothetical protein